MREVPPIMVLSEETPDSITFRFKGDRWAVATLIPGVILLLVIGVFYSQGHSPNWLLFIVGIFGLLLVYSSIYSATADQWLTVDGKRKTIRFYKKNLYGLVDWERSAPDFQYIKVGRSIRSTNWRTTLVCRDGDELYIGENTFGAFNLESALILANKVSSKTGIIVKSQ